MYSFGHVLLIVRFFPFLELLPLYYADDQLADTACERRRGIVKTETRHLAAASELSCATMIASIGKSVSLGMHFPPLQCRDRHFKNRVSFGISSVPFPRMVPLCTAVSLSSVVHSSVLSAILSPLQFCKILVNLTNVFLLSPLSNSL